MNETAGCHKRHAPWCERGRNPPTRFVASAPPRLVGRRRGQLSGPAAVPRVRRPDAAPCAAMGGARRRPRNTLSVCYLPSRATKGGRGARAWGARNGARAWGAAARRGHRALPQRGTGGARGEGAARRARGTMPRTAPMARRRDGDIAPYRNGTRGMRRGGRVEGEGCKAAHRADGAAARAGRPGGQASRPTAMLHEVCARQRGTGGAHGCGRVCGVGREGPIRCFRGWNRLRKSTCSPWRRRKSQTKRSPPFPPYR